MTPKIRKQFLLLIRGIKNDADLNETARLLSEGRVDEALAVVQAQASVFANQVTQAFIRSAEEASSYIASTLLVSIVFDQTNVRAVNLMRDTRLRLIREFSQEQRNATRIALTLGIEQGLNPRAQALAFRDSIGLTVSQVRAVENYRRLLETNNAESLTRALRDRRFDPSIRSALQGDRVLSSEQIARMVDRYRERFINYRSEVIARTEALRAVHTGSHEMFQQAIDDGQLQADELQQEWLTADDERVRGSHHTMHHQLRDFGQPFVSGNGYFLRYPGDPGAPAKETIQCRCVVTTRIKGD